MGFGPSPISKRPIECFEKDDTKDNAIDELDSALADHTTWISSLGERGTQWIQPDADFSARKLNSALFTEAVLPGANFSDAELRDADLSAANVASTLFDRADLSGATLVKADLDNASLRFATLVAAKLIRVSCFEADFSHAVLDNADFRGAYLVRANFTGASCVGTNFEGASLTDAIGLALELDSKTAIPPARERD